MSELGLRLKEAREEKGYTLDDVQSLTKIQKRYLEGIEEGNYTMMPGSFYVKAFIKQYAEAVELDPEALIREYPNDIPKSDSEPIPSHISRSQTRKSTAARRSSSAFTILPSILIGVFIVGILVVVWFVASNWATNNNDDSPAEETATTVGIEESENTEAPAEEEEAPAEEEAAEEEAVEEEPAEEEPPALTIENSGTEGETTTYAIENAEELEVTITSDNTWIGITAEDGSAIASQEVTGGDTFTFDASDLDWFRIRIGSAPGTEVQINGETVEYGLPADSRITQNMIFEVQ